MLSMKIPFKKTKRGVQVRVKVQPCSSKKGIGDVAGDVLKVYLTAPPVDGAANEQLVDVLCKALGVKKSSVRIARGLSSREKVVEVIGIDEL